MIPRLVPTSQIHHGHTRLIMLFGSTQRRRRLLRKALFDDAKMNLRAIRQLFARANLDLFQQLLRFNVFLLMELLNGLLVGL